MITLVPPVPEGEFVHKRALLFGNNNVSPAIVKPLTNVVGDALG